jgi:undecaprenyl-diphosphatase
MGRVAHVGDGAYVFGGLGLTYGLAWLLDNLGLRVAGLAVALMVLVTMGVVTLIKVAIRRPRPGPPGEFVAFHYDIYSFPSGHSARLATLAMGMAGFYPFLGPLLWGLALFVALARIAVGIHYVSDVAVGLGLGALVAWLVTALFSP